MTNEEMLKMWSERKGRLLQKLKSNSEIERVKVEIYIPEDVFNWLSVKADKYGKSIEETATLIFSKQAYKEIGGEK